MNLDLLKDKVDQLSDLYQHYSLQEIADLHDLMLEIVDQQPSVIVKSVQQVAINGALSEQEQRRWLIAVVLCLRTDQ